jgi:hypothetical protein
MNKFVTELEDVEIIRAEDVSKHGSHDQSSHGNWATGGVSSGLTQSVLDRVRTNGGLSVNMRNGSEPSSGYMVASPVKKAPIVDADDFYDPIKGRKILGDFVKANKSTLGSGKKYLGLWHNKEDNKVYLDVSENVQDKARAVQLGRERNQISIWDVVNFDEIQTGGTGVTKEGRNSDGRTSIEYLGNDGRPDRQLGGFDLQQNQEVVKHGSHDQSSHAGDRGKGNKTPEAETEKPESKDDRKRQEEYDKPRTSAGSIKDRVKALAEKGRRIIVKPSEVREVMDEFAKREDNPDLTSMHIDGTNLYDEDNLGIPRNKMPQVPSDKKGAFISVMEKRGVKIQRADVDPMKLHPIQAEISATKSAKIMKRLREKGTATDDAGRIVISNDNYVIDGHHRWAATSMLKFENPSIKLPVIKVDMSHRDLIEATLAWNKATGIESLGMGESNPSSTFKKWKEFDEIVAKAVRGRTVIRFQPGLKPTLKHLSGQHDQSTHGSWAGYKPNDAASWGEERAKVLDKTKGGPSVAQLNKFFEVEENIEADNVLESMKPDIKNLFNDDIRGKDGMLYKIEIDDENIQMSTNADAKYRKIFIEGTINSMDGNYAGVFQRAIYRDLNTKGIIVSHELLELEPEVQGNGIGSKFYMNAENKYIVNGYEKIAVHAALDQGGYVWAKTGFGWDDGTGLSESGRQAYRNQMVQRWRDMAENDAQVYEVLSRDVSARTRFNDLVDSLEQKSIDSKDAPTPYELASFKSSTGEKIGKIIMQNSNWHGVKFLTPSGKKRNQ